MDTALVTGVGGQDGIYLAHSLLRDGKRVVGTVTPESAGSLRVATYLQGVEVVPLDVRDAPALRTLVEQVEPTEVYNLAAVSSVGRSWQQPELTIAVNQTAVEVLVDAVLATRDRTGRDVRFFQASTAEVSGTAAESPYARAKAAAEDVVRTAREQSGLHACYARLHIHESPVRTVAFVTRKITRGVAEIALGQSDRLVLGTLDVVRDWGFAGDYVEAIRLMTAADDPVDLPIGTGRPHSLLELVECAFAAAGLGRAGTYVEQDPSLVRPADTAVLVADPEPALRAIGWRAQMRLKELVGQMVAVDMARLRSGVAESVDYLFPRSAD
ncbi:MULTISPECIES: GDP-mannose 4,6-dehydratase [Nocardioides]|uniref:GDP-mannose 4,6-dehydratase n=1 Tax=Nocardioides vastitatis TaxID=2568655 RepID=A0ABW0Z8W0_9ACTN|nr:GDP-mannose 4,6-dehydratase [Nocardioides sp.]